jgi:hypothetical protein
MYIDALLLLSDAQAVTADAVSTNTIDLGNVTPKRAIGTGEPMGIVFTVDVAADATTGDETYSFEVIQSAAAALSSPDVIATLTLAAATLVAGYQFVIPIPPGFPTKRYLGVNYNVGGTTPTITVTAALMPLSMASVAPVHYADAITIS